MRKFDPRIVFPAIIGLIGAVILVWPTSAKHQFYATNHWFQFFFPIIWAVISALVSAKFVDLKAPKIAYVILAIGLFLMPFFIGSLIEKI